MKKRLILFLLVLSLGSCIFAQTDENLQNLWELEQYKNYEEFYQGSEVEEIDEPGVEAIDTVQMLLPIPEEGKTVEFAQPVEEITAPQDSAINLMDISEELFTMGFDAANTITTESREEISPEKQREAFELVKTVRRSVIVQRKVVSKVPAPKSYLKRAIAGPTRSRYAGRMEIRELNLKDPLERQAFFNSRGTLGMISADRLSSDDGETYLVDGNVKMGETMGLCEDEPFWDQPSACFCTAFLVDSMTVATAGHCIQNIPIEDIRLILGYESARADGEVDLELPARNVFGVQEIVGATDGQDLDFVLLKLDHPANAQKVLQLAEAAPAIGDSVYAIGYPSGLPMKIAGVGTVSSGNNGTYFYSDLETYQGNSGSPVFNAQTHEVVGIIIEGDQDFETVGNCKRARECYGRNCKGEKAISVVRLIPYLQQLLRE